ncbi:MAG: 2-C-methyl-D-erythritol 2,4-cyclodiphosphate synthase [Aquificaceae bacterium]
MNLRIGFGFDSHEFDFKKPCFLGGIEIPEEPGFKAHSDGDLILHALCDALLSAAQEPDLGTLFPDTLEVNKNRSSEEFLKEALSRVSKKGLKLLSVDITLVGDRPKIMPYRELIVKNLKELLKTEFVGLKGKTSEGLCIKGMACFAVVLLNGS